MLQHGQALAVLADGDQLAVELAEFGFGQHADPHLGSPRACPPDLP